MPLRVLVVDDEFPAREELVCLLEESNAVEVVATCEDGEEALDLLRERPVDAVFLDIQMPTVDGLSVAREIRRLPGEVKVVFTTGFSEHAVKAFELDAVDYLVKPYSKQRLDQALKKLRDARKEKDHSPAAAQPEQESVAKLPVWANGRMVLLNTADIFFVKADGKRSTLVCAKKGDFNTSLTLKELEAKLGKGFLRTHKSYLVNAGKIEEVVPWFNNTYLLVLQDCQVKDIPVARHYVQDFNRRMRL